MVNFDFLEKGLEVVSPPHFVYYFSKKKEMSHAILCSINWSNFISWIVFTSWGIRQYLYCNCLFTLPACAVINFGINIIFPIKLFFDMTENSKQKFEYRENEKSF